MLKLNGWFLGGCVEAQVEVEKFNSGYYEVKGLFGKEICAVMNPVEMAVEMIDGRFVGFARYKDAKDSKPLVEVNREKVEDAMDALLDTAYKMGVVSIDLSLFA